ncbi:MAG: (5-formylfuran-3-yl)methyl phosphate synthase [Pseudomonadota bacterium]
MTQLLISVKSAEEALIALDAGVDIIDLKDPNIGALGALDLNASLQILQKVQQYKQLSSSRMLPLTSATVGEGHADLDVMLKEIDARVKMGIDIIKIAVSDLFNNTDCLIDITQSQHVKLIAVFFADQSIDLNLLEKLKDSGFYGAMIDTHKKQQNLLEICTLSTLQKFTQICEKNGLKSGLAGSLKPLHIEDLVAINPSYIGFRGGVCSNESRINGLIRHKIVNVKQMLQEHNKTKCEAQVSLGLALHS